ncbi:24733_t:CDS:2 [Cetraspora pellucida]|uniref:24733_t:CDS:1 n=1 Tax=Cetraspora pellucida TaxID=1433469 RepID=A0A9N9N538_9GLOM|nr:24733_t:CDS:2 [Cetraspora pellucida]
MSNKLLSEGELTKKYPKQAELLKALEINILKGYPNSLASNITIPELENCHECNKEILLNPPKAFTMLMYNEEMASAKVQNVDMSEAIKDKVKKLSVDSGKVIPRSETKSIKSNKLQGLIKELSMPSEPIDDNNRENKSKESKPITLLQLYYNANQTENI